MGVFIYLYFTVLGIPLDCWASTLPLSLDSGRRQIKEGFNFTLVVQDSEFGPKWTKVETVHSDQLPPDPRLNVQVTLWAQLSGQTTGHPACTSLGL